VTFVRFNPREPHTEVRKLRNLRKEAPQYPDGCTAHDVTPEQVAARWRRLEAIIAATPEDDHNAQWSVVSMCPCCCGPSRVENLLCRQCEDADLDELRKAPPCVVCGMPGLTIEERVWVCESHRSAR